MNFGGLIFLLVCHYLSGRGVLRLFKIALAPLPAFCVAMMVGVPVISFGPCILQLLHIPIDAQSVTITAAVMGALHAIPLFVPFRRPRFKFNLPQLYQVPFLLVITALVLISVWRCYYYPTYARDMLSGPELIAEYTVREKTMINSVFTIDLHTTNNHFKSPYITTLQVIYKLLVHPFGGLWLSVLFVSFMIWLYTLVKERIHPVLAGFLLFLFISTPELYAYTYLVLYDYSNMVLFFCGFYFLVRYTDEYKANQLLFAAFLFGIATYIRAETLMLVAMIVPLLLVYLYKDKMPKQGIVKVALFMAVPVFFYVLCIHVFVRLFVPVPFDVGGQMNQDLGNISVFFHRLLEVQSPLIFSRGGLLVFGFFIPFFYAVLLVDLAWQRKFSRESVIMLYGIAVVMIGLPFISYLFPLADLYNTTKRGLFKMLPLMLIYLANSSTLQRLSELIKKWEFSMPKKSTKAYKHT
ncbi:MAG: hypothetical protein K0Q79_675 [Flavipsychrobacter sp.]|jgi:hypothetical protein|nr:hypothetical protein [Flavipsychrobacter sp.]